MGASLSRPASSIVQVERGYSGKIPARRYLTVSIASGWYMGWHVEYVEAQRTVRASYSGRTTVNQLVEMVESAVSMAAARRTDRILLDCTSAKSTLTAAQIYQLPLMFEEVGIHGIDRVAIVHGSDSHNTEDFSYYGTLAREYGFDHQVFTDVVSAIRWLASFPVKERHTDSEVKPAANV